MQPNRIVASAAAVCGLAGAVAVPLAKLDISSTIGVIGGLAAILGVARTWLVGWQQSEQQAKQHQHELRVAAAYKTVVPTAPKAAAK